MITDEDKNKFLDELRKTSIVGNACNKLNISRATIYRWKKEDEVFRIKFIEAMAQGRDLMNDAAESVIIGGIRNKDPKSSKYYLEHNHPNYMANRYVVDQHIKNLEVLEHDEAHSVLECLEAARLFHQKYGDISFDEWMEQKGNGETDQPTSAQS